ncbi:MAG TPA: isoaspartyl peptidase/L-asparaginase, partial [Lysobacter sp.]|nr:isoaspartyl peptidase/L-asparaginase [Lysobacter sp.]
MHRFAALLLALTVMTAHAAEKPKTALVIHGGAGVIERSALSKSDEREVRAALDRALDAGNAVLAKGGSALDAVEAAVVVLEESPHFN